MICRSFSYLVLFAVLVGLTAESVNGQDSFVGEDQPVRRIIKLRSPGTTPDDASETPVVETTESASGAIAEPTPTSAPAVPPSVEFDEIDSEATAADPSAPVNQESYPVPASPLEIAERANPATPQNESAQQPIEPQNDKTVSISTPEQTVGQIIDPAMLNVAESTSLVITEIKSPKYVNVNQIAPMMIQVRNQGTRTVNNAKIVAKLPAHTQLADATPMPQSQDEQHVVFAVPAIEADGIYEVRMSLIPKEKKPLDIATHVVVENQQQTSVDVRQPELKLSLQGPQQANIGQTIAHELVISNQGDGIASNIRLTPTFPVELESLDQIDGQVIPTIEPGDSVRVLYRSLAVTPGPIKLKIDANTDGAPAKSCAMDFTIYQPELRISAVGPKLSFVQRGGIYTVSIDNTGEVDVTDIEIALRVPSGMKVTTISRKAKVDEGQGILTWHYPKISANTTERLQLKAVALAEGIQSCAFRLSSNETQTKEIQLDTQVVTRADLSVRIKNLTGPVQVGGKAEFLVEVENQGSRQADEVKIQIALPESLMAIMDNKVLPEQSSDLVFVEPVVTPGQKVTFKFTAVGVIEGEHVVRSTLETIGSTRPVISEDTVLVYETAQARVSESVGGEARR